MYWEFQYYSITSTYKQLSYSVTGCANTLHVKMKISLQQNSHKYLTILEYGIEIQLYWLPHDSVSMKIGDTTIRVSPRFA